VKIGFIGLGTMGRAMAANLLKAGHALFAHDHKPVPEALFAQGAIACGSGEEVARQADVVITMVPDTPHVASALFDPGGKAWDHSAMVRALEYLANFEIGQKRA
jgi:2-hydroxy-3-oxopropionate reductase